MGEREGGRESEPGRKRGKERARENLGSPREGEGQRGREREGEEEKQRGGRSRAGGRGCLKVGLSTMMGSDEGSTLTPIHTCRLHSLYAPLLLVGSL